MRKREAERFLSELQKRYPEEKEKIEIKEIKRGDWSIFIPNELFVTVPFSESGIEASVRLKPPCREGKA